MSVACLFISSLLSDRLFLLIYLLVLLTMFSCFQSQVSYVQTQNKTMIRFKKVVPTDLFTVLLSYCRLRCRFPTEA